MGPKPRPIEQRFWAKVSVGDLDECWPWQAYRLPAGYGKLDRWLAHRLAWTMANGPIPDDLTIDHLCANTSCVNVRHMELVTLSENMRRQIQRRRDNHTLLRTSCKQGHLFTPENTFPKPKGAGRECRTCRNTKGREWMRLHRRSRRKGE